MKSSLTTYAGPWSDGCTPSLNVPPSLDVRKETWLGRNPWYSLVGNINVTSALGTENILVNVCEYRQDDRTFQKCLLLNHNGENICRNLYCKKNKIFFEIPSHIVQITSHFEMWYRGNHSLSCECYWAQKQMSNSLCQMWDRFDKALLCSLRNVPGWIIEHKWITTI